MDFTKSCARREGRIDDGVKTIGNTNGFHWYFWISILFQTSRNYKFSVVLVKDGRRRDDKGGLPGKKTQAETYGLYILGVYRGIKDRFWVLFGLVGSRLTRVILYWLSR